MGKMIIGAQMYTLRDYCKTPADVARTLEKVRKMGYRVIQISAMAKMDPKELKKLLDDNGLSACSTHVGYPEIVKETNRIVEEHKILGCEAAICPGLPMELHNEDGYLKVSRNFQKVLARFQEAGLALAYHNHAIEFQRYGGKTGLEILLDNCPALEAEIDTYWVQHGGGDPAFWIEKYTGRVSQTHFKDMGIIKNQQVMPPIGNGNLNWKRLVQACQKAGTRYCLVEMDTPTIDAFETLRISFENMKAWGLAAR